MIRFMCELPFRFSNGYINVNIVDFIEHKNLPEILLEYTKTLPVEAGKEFKQIITENYKGYTAKYLNKPTGKLKFVAVDRFMVEILYSTLPSFAGNDMQLLDVLDHSKFEKFKK